MDNVKPSNGDIHRLLEFWEPADRLLLVSVQWACSLSFTPILSLYLTHRLALIALIYSLQSSTSKLWNLIHLMPRRGAI